MPKGGLSPLASTTLPRAKDAATFARCHALHDRDPIADGGRMIGARAQRRLDVAEQDAIDQAEVWRLSSERMGCGWGRRHENESAAQRGVVSRLLLPLDHDVDRSRRKQWHANVRDGQGRYGGALTGRRRPHFFVCYTEPV